jgi:hypothetical protein
MLVGRSTWLPRVVAVIRDLLLDLDGLIRARRVEPDPVRPRLHGDSLFVRALAAAVLAVDQDAQLSVGLRAAHLQAGGPGDLGRERRRLEREVHLRETLGHTQRLAAHADPIEHGHESVGPW